MVRVHPLPLTTFLDKVVCTLVKWFKACANHGKVQDIGSTPIRAFCHICIRMYSFDSPPFSFENTSLFHNLTGTQVMGFLSSHISLNVSSCLTSDTIIFFITQTKKKTQRRELPERGASVSVLCFPVIKPIHLMIS